MVFKFEGAPLPWCMMSKLVALGDGVIMQLRWALVWSLRWSLTARITPGGLAGKAFGRD